MLLVIFTLNELLTMSEKDEQPETTPKPELVQLDFSFKPVDEKPTRRYRKGSKYDPVIDAFIKSDEILSELNIVGKDGNYIRTQLNKRIVARKLGKKLKVSVINNKCYLEK